MKQKIAGLMVIAMIAALTIIVTAAPAPAFSNSCGSGGHTGNTTTELASAWWNSVNDPDCWVKVAAKCDVSPSGSGTWYWGSKAYIGGTSFYDCDWRSDGKNELVTWGYGWGPQ